VKRKKNIFTSLALKPPAPPPTSLTVLNVFLSSSVSAWSFLFFQGVFRGKKVRKSARSLK
jgi:hypothetical protein